MTTKVQWKRLDAASGPHPKPRHGHRAVAIKDLIIIFGGGNEGIVEDLNVYNCATNQWFQPSSKGDVPTGCAAFGFATDGSKIIVFGGMVEYGKYSADLWELNPIAWQWRKLKPRPPRTVPLPCARLGHTLTYAEGKYYLFGGLANDSKDPKQNMPRYLNDLYALESKGNNYAWEQPITRGAPPMERESHSCVFYRGQVENRPKLIIYGGMNGHRLGDIWTFHLDFSQWTQITASGLAPQPRSLHSSVIIGHRMFVFGGWVPLISSEKNEQFANEKEWKCTNTLASFNLETNAWELLGHECLDENTPRARAGHCAVTVNTRMFIWSGRDGYRKAWNNQVCCKDLWCLETACPGEPEKVQLLKAGIGNLEILWNPVPSADSYILQIQRFEAPAEQPPPLPAASLASQAPIHSPLQSISASLFASKSPQSVLASLIPMFTNEAQQQQQQTSTSAVSAMADSARMSSSPTPMTPSIGTVNAHTLQLASQAPNSTSTPSMLFQKSMPTSVQNNPSTQTIRPLTASNIQFFNTASNSMSTGARPIIFHQKASTPTTQPQLLTVMPAGVRVQQLTPVVRGATNQAATIVRLMSPAMSNVRPSTGQQQIIQLNTNKQQQQQPLVIKAITGPNIHRQQAQPILLAANTQQKMIAPQTQPQQVLLLNQNSFNNNQSTQAKFTLQPGNAEASNSPQADQVQPESTGDSTLPQLDGSGSVDMCANDTNQISTVERTLDLFQQHRIPSKAHPWIPQIDGVADDQSIQNGTSDAQHASSPIQQQTPSTVIAQTATTDSPSIIKNEAPVQLIKTEIQPQLVSHDSKPTETDDSDGWHLVGTFKTTTTDIKHYYVVPSKINIDNYDLASLQVHNLVKKVDLEPGVIYKLRIAAVNACGRGPWSEAAAFKTCLPGSPPAPSNIKITKTSDGGAHLNWDPPSNASSLITGYAVYLAVKNSSGDNATPRQPQQQASQMAFVRVYGGVLAECSVNAAQLLQAHLDTTSSSKPAIIFRIAARNERGYGPATQVRWLQDQQQISSNMSNIHLSTSNNSLKRTGSNSGSAAAVPKKQRATPGAGPSDV